MDSIQHEEPRRSYSESAPRQSGALGALSAHIVAILERDLASHGSDLGRMATLLTMSVRTLQRRLLGEGTSYRELTDEARIRRWLSLSALGPMPDRMLARELGLPMCGCFGGVEEVASEPPRPC